MGCTWPSNTCKVLYFRFGGQNDLLRTMWYFIIQLILHLYNILGLVSGKIDPEIMDRELKRNGPKKINFLFLQKNCLRPGDLINVIGTEILRSVAEIMDREFEKKMVQKKLIFFSTEKLSKAWGPHKCHQNRNPQVRC